jgi:hypothetical protein
MEYTVRKVKGKWGVFTPTGICFDAFISEAKANHIARMHNEAIAPLQTELETLRTRVQELEAELSENKGAIKVAVDNLPEQDESRAFSPKWTGIVWSAYISRNLLSSLIAPKP